MHLQAESQTLRAAALSFLPAAAAHGLLLLPDLVALATLHEPAVVAVARELRLMLIGPGFGGAVGGVVPPADPSARVATGTEAGGAAACGGVIFAGPHAPCWLLCDADFGEAAVLQALQSQLRTDRAAEAAAAELLPATCCGLVAAGLRGAGAAGAEAPLQAAVGAELLGPGARHAACCAAAAALAAHAPLRTLLLSDAAALYQGMWAPQPMAGMAAVLDGAPASPARPWALPHRLVLQSLAAGALHVMAPAGCLVLEPAAAQGQGRGAQKGVLHDPHALSWRMLRAAVPAEPPEGSPLRSPDAPAALGLLAACRMARPGWLDAAWAAASLQLDEAQLSEALRRDGQHAKQVRGERSLDAHYRPWHPGRLGGRAAPRAARC
jgi:hypothetical protein